MTSPVDEPAWVEHAVWWHVYPLGFTGADPTGASRAPGGGFDRLTRWLDHAQRLGVSGVALGPVFASTGHGYDTVDHRRVDERLGDDAGFDRFVAAATERGLRVQLDGVFNHVGRAFADAHPDWVRRRSSGEYRVFEGHEGLVELDHSRDDVAAHVTDVMNHWLDRGIASWRLDAAYTVDPSFWTRVLPPVRAAHPEVYVVGEVLHGDYAATVRAGGLDAVTQYELWKAIWSAIRDRNFFELAHALGRHDELLPTFVPWTFVGNHDVTRLASQLPDTGHRDHALVVLFTVAGTPAVYYGDERGWAAVKEDRVGGDDAIRPAYEDVPPAELPAAEAAVLRRHQELIGLRRRHPWLHRATVSVVDLANEHLVYDVAGDGNRLRVLLNLADEGMRHEAPGQTLAGSDGVTDAGDGRVGVPPHGWAVRG